MATKPLAYESLKCVLQRMEANKRIQISQYCHSIRTAERVTPLKIDSLEFESGQIKINNTTYSIGIFKKFHVGEAPDAFRIQNEQGGVKFEVDKFGIEDRDDAQVVASGDVDLRRKELPLANGIVFELPEDVRRRNIEEIEAIVMYLESAPPRPGGVSRRTMLQAELAELIPLYYERDHAPPPFENLIQLNVSSQGSYQIAQYKHNKKYHQAVKQLGVALFGERKQPIYVNTLRTPKIECIIRLPIELKFHIRGIQFEGNVTRTCDSLSPIIHDSSYPFKHIHVRCLGQPELTHPVVKEADTITLSPSHPEGVTGTLSKLTNRRVHIKNSFPGVFSINTVKFLIRNRIEGGHRTHFSFEFSMKQPFETWMSQVRIDFDGAARGNRSVIIPMDGTSQMVVSHKEIFNLELSRQSWILEMVVEDVKQK